MPSIRKSLFYFFILCVLPVFQGCSWVNNFYVSNTTNEEVKVEILLNDSPGDFPIFYNEKNLHVAYKINSHNGPDYPNTVPVQKEKTGSTDHVIIILQPKTTLQIGALSNDKYTSHKQNFINGRVFNLKLIKISQKNIERSIDPDQFDAQLKKVKGDFVYAI